MNKEKSDKIKNYFIFGFIISLFVIIFLSFLNSSDTISIETVADCLSETNSVMYGTLSCPYCNTQKDMFKDQLYKIDFVNCEQNSQECFNNEIRAYPSWIINGRTYEGMKDLDTLYKIAECEN